MLDASIQLNKTIHDEGLRHDSNTTGEAYRSVKRPFAELIHPS